MSNSKKKVTIIEFQPGDDVTLTVEKGNVTRMAYGIRVDEATDGYKVGTIKSVNNSSKSIKLELGDGETETIYLASTCELIDSDGALSLKIADFEKGDKIIVVGEYKNSKYMASVVVLYYE